MDGKPGPKRRLAVILLLLLFALAKGEVYDSWQLLPITGKIYTRDPKHDDGWAVNAIYYPKYVRIIRTEITHAHNGDNERVEVKNVYYENAYSPWWEHCTYWEDFKYRYQ